ncbi:MAG: PLDc N-terminal domain-containing protein [Candidatus Aenigmatarchaeota archaeon]
MLWFFGGLGFLFLCLAIFAVVFWVWMLIDCLGRKKFEDKLVWVIVLIFLNFIGAVLYYILVKSKD